jgi:hypothetical protein
VGVRNEKNESLPITDGRRVNTSKTMISQLEKAGAQLLLEIKLGKVDF